MGKIIEMMGVIICVLRASFIARLVLIFNFQHLSLSLSLSLSLALSLARSHLATMCCFSGSNVVEITLTTLAFLIYEASLAIDWLIVPMGVRGAGRRQMHGSLLVVHSSHVQ